MVWNSDLTPVDVVVEANSFVARPSHTDDPTSLVVIVLEVLPTKTFVSLTSTAKLEGNIAYLREIWQALLGTLAENVMQT